jgi:hypothetical protein
MHWHRADESIEMKRARESLWSRRDFHIHEICEARTDDNILPKQRENVLDTGKRRDVMGDKGGKKDKEKGQKQHSEKQKQKEKNKLDKQPKRRP